MIYEAVAMMTFRDNVIRDLLVGCVLSVAGRGEKSYARTHYTNLIR